MPAEAIVTSEEYDIDNIDLTQSDLVLDPEATLEGADPAPRLRIEVDPWSLVENAIENFIIDDEVVVSQFILELNELKKSIEFYHKEIEPIPVI